MTDRGVLRDRRTWRWVAFPVLVFAAFVVMVGLNLNGSSIALLSDATHAPGLVAGTPRAIRADEYLIETPLAVSAVRQSFPDTQYIGLTPIDQIATTHAGPTVQWPTLFKPQSWGYLVAGSSRGLAVSWWWPYVIGLWGSFALIGLLTRRPLLSAALACAATFTPYAGWWSAPAPPLYIGYTAAAGACVIGAWLVSRRWVAAVLGAAAGAFGVALTLALYPPWEISLVFVLAALVVGFGLDHAIPWRRLVWPTALGLGVAVALLGVWFLQNDGAIRAQTDTVYPGHQVSAAGTATWAQLLDAPLNFWMTGTAGGTLGTAGHLGTPANQSEAASSWLPLPVAALIVLGALELIVVGLRSRRRREARPAADAPEVTRDLVWTLSLLSGVGLLLLGWAVLPLPGALGSLTELRRVEPYRTQLALGFDALLLVAVATRVSVRRPVAWRWPVLVVAALATAATTVYSERHLPWDRASVPTVLVVLSGLALGATFAGLLRRRVAVVAALTLAVYAVVSWGLINPLQHGITPLTRDRLVRSVKSATHGTANPRVEVFGRETGVSLVLVAKVRAAGLQSLTGTTLYPNAALMSRLTPTQRSLWNNYAQYRWVAAPAGTPATIVQTHGTQMQLTVSPCDPTLLAGARPGWVVSDSPLAGSCLTPVSSVRQQTGSVVHLYRVST